jgi:hypothetical protein
MSVINLAFRVATFSRSTSLFLNAKIGTMSP